MQVNKKATSFMSEHTVEFTLVPVLKNILAKNYNFVIPIFPWMTREGSNISKHIHQNDRFKILGLYPRRPKTTQEDRKFIHLKINEQIILGAQKALSLGIPIIAGCPLAMNFWELGNNPTCLWIRLNYKPNVNKEFKININKSMQMEKALSKMVLQQEDDVLRFINKNAILFDIVKAMEAFKKIKTSSLNLDYYSNFAYWGGYKPIYFLLK